MADEKAGNSSGPARLVVISHSPFVYLWPVWAVGFLMAGWTYFAGHPVAFVPQGTVVERGGRAERFDGSRDMLVAPPGRTLPEGQTIGSVRMVVSNSPGIIWGMTLCFALIVTHVQIRKLRSVIIVGVLALVSIVLAFFGLWDPIVRAIQIFEIHITANGYLSISLLLLIAWLLMYFVYDRQMSMTFTPGEVRVRLAFGAGERPTTRRA